MNNEIKIKMGVDNTDFKNKVKENINLLEKAKKQAKEKVQLTLDVGNLASGVLTGLKSVASSMVLAGVEYESAITRAGANFNLEKTSDEFIQLNEYAKELGRSTLFTSRQAADGLNFLAKAGYSTADAMKALPQLMEMTIAVDGDLANVSDMVTDAIGAFGLSVNDLGHLQDVLAKTTVKSNVSLDQMFQSIKSVAPVAHALGFSIEETAASIGMLGDAGIKGEQAGTHLKAFMANLVKPSKDMTKTMQQYGISIHDSAGKMKSFAGILASVKTATANLSKEDRARVLTTLAGKEALASVSVLMNKSTNDFNKYIDVLKQADGAAKHLADMNKQTLGASLKMLSSAIDGFNMMLFDASSGGIAFYVAALTGMINGITEFMHGNDIMIYGLKFLINFVSSAAIAIGVLRGGMLLYNVVMGAARIATMLFGGSLRFAFGWLGGIITALTTIITFWDQIQGFFGFGKTDAHQTANKKTNPIDKIGNAQDYAPQITNNNFDNSSHVDDIPNYEKHLKQIAENTSPQNNKSSGQLTVKTTH